MITLTGARLLDVTGPRLEIALERGFRLTVFALDSHLARVLVSRPGGLRLARTWSISPEIGNRLDAAGCEPIEGRDRLDTTGFPGAPLAVTESDREIIVESMSFRLAIQRSPLALAWSFRTGPDAAWTVVLEDRPTAAYQFDRVTPHFTHYLKRDRAERYYGFGDKTGDADKHGRRLRMGTTDALGYDAASSDPLYKHIPYYMTVRPDRGGSAVGVFYDTLARGDFDLGQEIDAYHGRYRSFAADDGDLDLYVLFGPAAQDVVGRFAGLTGRMAFLPRWTLSYSGSTMQYTDAPDAADRLVGFLDLVDRHAIPCRSFHMSSGYTLIGDRRYVFTWNRDRFPDPRAVTVRFREAGVHLVANIKPAMLLDHPRFAEVEAFGGFVRDSENPDRPHVTQFWGGAAAYLDFTNPRTSAWWTRNVAEQIIDNGIDSIWNDNNEYEIWDSAARVDGAGAGGTMACLRPVQTLLMARASHQAQLDRAPGLRPYLISRSGGPGLQRYAQTWSGDNRTEWKTLRYNLRMGHGFSLSALFNFGHDVGGFEGPPPGPELLVRWVEQGIYWPRFSIHSWNDDGSPSEPWMYPDMLPLIQAAMNWRERLVPLLYTLAWHAHRRHEPILRPLFLEFPGEPQSYDEDDTFMLGSQILVAPIVEPGVSWRTAWLPDTVGGWFDVRDGARLANGRVRLEAPLGSAPVLARAGTILPLGPAPSWHDGPLSIRLFPLAAGTSTTVVYDDDGESSIGPGVPPCLVRVNVTWGGQQPVITIARSGTALPRWHAIQFEDQCGRPLPVTVNGLQSVVELPAADVRVDEAIGSGL